MVDRGAMVESRDKLSSFPGFDLGKGWGEGMKYERIMLARLDERGVADIFMAVGRLPTCFPNMANSADRESEAAT